jgi:hypothetical protein
MITNLYGNIASLFMLSFFIFQQVNANDLIFKYKQIDKSHPLRLIHSNGQISQKPFEFDPKKFELRGKNSLNVLDILSCEFAIVYNSDVNFNLLVKAIKKTKNSIEKNDYVTTIKKGLNVISIFSQKAHSKKILKCEEYDKVHIKGKENILKFADQNRTKNSKWNIDFSSIRLTLEFYEYPFMNISPEQVTKQYNEYQPKLIQEIEHFLKNIEIPEEDYASLKDRLEYFRKNKLNSKKKFNNETMDFCNNPEFHKGTIFYEFNI